MKTLLLAAVLATTTVLTTRAQDPTAKHQNLASQAENHITQAQPPVLQAQILSGTVTDAASTPVAYANIVALAPADSTYLGGTTSDDNGAWTMDRASWIQHTHQATILLRVSCIGYDDTYITVGSSATADRPIAITLNESSLLLSEVTVTAQAPQYKMTAEGLTTNVQGTVLARIGTAEDVLDHVPGVVRKDDAWEVFGKGTPIIYINGRQVHDLTELDRIKAGDIRSVEVIQNPGAKYNAAVGAVIRIRTNRLQGEGMSVDARAVYGTNKYNQCNAMLKLGYRRNALDAFAQYSYYSNQTYSDMDFSQTMQADTLWEHTQTLFSRSHNDYHNLETGLNYDLADDHSLGIKYLLSIAGREYDKSWGDDSVLADGAFYDYIASSSRTDGHTRPTNRLSAYYTGHLGKTSIDLNVDFYRSHALSESLNDEDSQEKDSRDLTSVSDVVNRLWAAKLALSSPLLGGTLDYGAELTDTRRTDIYTSSRTDIVAGTDSRIDETTIAAYLEYARQTPIGQLRAGLRYEYAGFDYHEGGVYQPEQSRTFHNLFPSVQLSRSWGKTQWSLSYSTKTQRPSYAHLSSNISYYNRFLRQSGNPLLTHETIHDVTLQGVWKVLQFTLGYNDRRNAIIYWTEQMTDDPSVSIIRYHNQHSLKSVQALISAAPRVGFWSPAYSAGVIKPWLTLHTDLGTYHFDKPLFLVNLNNAFTLPHGFTARVDLAFRSKGNTENVRMFRPVYNLSIALSRSFLHDALAVELKGTDLLYQQWNSVCLTTDQMQFRQDSRNGSRQFSITLRYKLNTSRDRYRGTGAGKSVLQRF